MLPPAAHRAAPLVEVRPEAERHVIRRNLPGHARSRCAFTIVVPAYNEQLQLEATVDRIVTLLDGVTDYEIVIVEDGCTDSTPLIADWLTQKYSHVQHIHSRVRLGKGLGVMEGMRVARGEVIVLMDADLSTDPDRLLECIARVRLGEADILIGSRYHDESDTRRTPLRKLLSVTYNVAARVLLGSRLKDHQCGFKIFDERAVRSILPFVRSHRFFWDTEVLAIAQWHGYRIQEVPVVWKEGKETKVRLFRTPIEMFGNMVRLAMARRRLSP